MQISVPYTEGSPPQESVVPVSQQPKLQHKTIYVSVQDKGFNVQW